MKRIGFIAAGFAALVSGCATTQNAASDDDVDHQKVATINSIARARGIELHWLRYPQRHGTPADSTPSLAPPTGS